MSTIQIKDGADVTRHYNTIEAGTSGEPHEPVLPPYAVTYSIGRVFADDGVTVSVQERAASSFEFGVNSDIGTSLETVWLTGGNETFLSANSINRVVSDDAGDTQDVIIFGHTISGNDFTLVEQTATLNGTSAVTLSTPLARVHRMLNNDNTDFAGDITIFINAGATYMTVASVANQSTKCSFTTASDEYLFVTAITFSASRSNTAKVDFLFQVRNEGKSFRTVFRGLATDTSGTHFIELAIPLIVKPNSDMRVQAISSAVNTEVWASFGGYLAVIT